MRAIDLNVFAMTLLLVLSGSRCMSVPPAESSSSYAAPGVTASEDKCRLQISGLPQSLSMPAPRWERLLPDRLFRQENSKLPPIDNTANRAVFVGDSMTGQWFLAEVSQVGRM